MTDYQKIYYCFAFDQNNEYTLRFRSGSKDINLNFIRSLVYSLHGIEAAAMCNLEFSSRDRPDELLPRDSAVRIGEHIIVRRVPIAEYRNSLKNIIDCYENKSDKRVNLEMLGITKEELEEVIQDNTGQSLNNLLTELKQKFMIEDENFYQQQQDTTYIPKQFLGSRAKARSKPEHQEESVSADDDAEEEEVPQDATDIVKDLYNKNTTIGKWYSCGKTFKK